MRMEGTRERIDTFMKVTIKDIAKMAGVTHPTVSKALNGAPGVSKEIRQKIMDIAEQMNYVPNLAAKRLVDRASDSIGLIWPKSEGLFFYHLCREIQKAGFKLGLNVMISMAEPPQALRMFNEHFIDRVLFWCPPNWTPTLDFMKQKEQFQGRMLLMGGGKLEGTHRISIDRRGGAYEAVKHLAEYGHTRIAFVGERAEKWHGFTQGIVELGLTYNPEYIITAEEGELFDEHKVVELLDRADRPTAFVVDSQSFSFELMKLLRKNDVRIPEQFSLVVYDDIPEMGMLDIPLTTVGPSIRALSDAALKMLVQPLNSAELGPWMNMEIKCELTVRDSTKPLNTKEHV